MTDLDPGQVMTIKRFNEIQYVQDTLHALSHSGRTLAELNTALINVQNEAYKRIKAQKEQK